MARRRASRGASELRPVLRFAHEHLLPHRESVGCRTAPAAVAGAL